ncbi:MAG: hypothetical protein ACX94A_07855 [Algiphilus sp.]
MAGLHLTCVIIFSALATAVAASEAQNTAADAGKSSSAATSTTRPCGTPTIPDSDLASFVFSHLDISTFRSSLGPKRSKGDRSFSDLEIEPTELSASTAVHDSDWLYRIEVVGVRDYTSNGCNEIAICLLDKAQNGGTYFTQNSYLLKPVDGRLVAIDYAISERELEDCGSFKR